MKIIAVNKCGECPHNDGYRCRPLRRKVDHNRIADDCPLESWPYVEDELPCARFSKMGHPLVAFCPAVQVQFQDHPTVRELLETLLENESRDKPG